MEEFGKFYEREDVEMVTDIPSGFVRKGLFSFLLLIVVLITLSCFIKVNKNIQVETKILSDKPVKIEIAPFGNDIDVNLSLAKNSNTLAATSHKIPGISYVENNKGIFLTKRNFKQMKDSIYTIQPNTNIKLFITIDDTSKLSRLLLGQYVRIDYAALHYVLSSHIVNVLNTSDGNYIYQLDASQLPSFIKYELLSIGDQSFFGELNNKKVTMFQQIYNNLFNKIKI